MDQDSTNNIAARIAQLEEALIDCRWEAYPPFSRERREHVARIESELGALLDALDALDARS